MSRICSFSVFLAIGLFFPLCLGAAPASLTLDEVLQQGINSNLELKRNLIDLSIAEYSKSKLWAEVFPAISASVGITYASPLFSGDPLDPRVTSTGGNARLGLNLDLNAGIPHTMKNIRLAYQSRLLDYNDAKNQLEIQITKTFYSLIAESQNVSVLDDMFKSAQLLYERNQVAFRNGLVNELTLMQSRLGMENARYSLSVARSVYVNHMEDFLTQICITYSEDTVFDGKIEITKVELDPFKLISEYLPQRPDVISKGFEIERLQNFERQLTLAYKAPSISLSTEWRSRRFSPFTDTITGSASVNIPIDPLIPGTNRNQSVRNARLEIEKAVIDLQDTKEKAAAQIRFLATNLKNLWDSIEIARLSQEAAELSYELTTQGFRGGVVDSMKVEDARNDLLHAHQRLLVTELSYLNMILDISAALNINWKEVMK